jgi:hypothetical protein
MIPAKPLALLASRGLWIGLIFVLACGSALAQAVAVADSASVNAWSSVESWLLVALLLAEIDHERNRCLGSFVDGRGQFILEWRHR